MKLTSGSRASARKSAMKTQVTTRRAIHVTASRIATPMMIDSTRRTVRVRTSTTRSGVTRAAWPGSRTSVVSLDGGDHRVDEDADALDLDFDDVAALEVVRVGPAHRNARGCAGCDHVARF